MLQAVEIKRADAAELRLRCGAVWCTVVHCGACVALWCRVVQTDRICETYGKETYIVKETYMKRPTFQKRPVWYRR